MKLFSRRASSAALQKDKQYKEFIRHNEAKGWNNERLAGEKGRVYAVATDEGVLFFSDSEKGMKVRNSYLQHLADGFFNMAKGTETLKMYEMETPSRQVAELADNCIDKLANCAVPIRNCVNRSSASLLRNRQEKKCWKVLSVRTNTT